MCRRARWGWDLRRTSRLTRWLRLWRATREAVARHRPDLVVVGGLGLPPLGSLGAPPVLAVVRDFGGRGWRALPEDPLVRLAAQVPRAVVVPTEEMRAQARSLGVGRWRLHRLPIGFDVPDAPLPLPPRGDVLELLHPGAIHPARGQHVSIDAVARLPGPLKRRVHLLVAGPVAHERYLAQLRVAAADQPVTLAPEVPDVGREMERAHVIVYPTSLQVGFPGVLVDAMARGRPVVWPDQGAMGEVMGGFGVRVPASDVASLRDAIASLVGREDLAALGAAGHAHVRERFTWARLWPRWRTLFDSVSRRPALRGRAGAATSP